MEDKRFLKYKHKNSFYTSKQWRELREYKLNLNPVCEVCLKKYKRYTAARDVDHIEPISANPDRALDITNLQALCFECHKEKTANENRERVVKNKRVEGKILNKRYNI